MYLYTICNLVYRAGLPKVGAILANFGAIIWKSAKGGKAIKNFETFTRYSWFVDEEQIKKVSGVLISNFEAYRVADKEQKKRS